ncbi:MAG: acyl-CoA dehydrogenase family protein [Promethearchaeota archaeon]|jgi:alkylation response protein AidB-like acyl-CoA dehydrogenase
MSSQEGNRDNQYSFDDYLFVRDNFNYYSDDEFFQALVKKYVGEEFEKLDRDLRGLSDYVSFRFRDLAEKANELENRIKVTKIKHFDAFNHRIDRIERCMETEILEQEVFSLGLFDPVRNTPWSRFVKMCLLYENSEAGVMCPVACTHGMVWLMQKYEDSLEPNAKEILNNVRDGINGDYKRGSQYVSEIQGGSDVPSNLVEAVFETEVGEDGYSNCWRLYGQKYFCSATHADYAVVTAKPKDTPSSTKIAAFVVPSWLPGNKKREIRNSYTIDRLKQKLGTAELPTAEITYNGSVAYPIGPLEKGLADVVGIVLSLSRLHCAFGMAAGALRVAREAILYSQFRTAFGVPISSFPLMINQINDLERFAKRSIAGAFKVHSEYIHFGEELISGIRELEKIDNIFERKRRFRLRELVMLQKIVVTDETPKMIRLAISFFGGHGIMEDFLSLPRFHRDSLIMELWEGPRNVLLTQIHRDFQKVKDWYSAEDFVRDLLRGLDSELIEAHALEFARIISHDNLLTNDDETLKICRDWERFSTELMISYQELALKELNFTGEPLKFSKLLRRFKKRIKNSPN